VQLLLDRGAPVDAQDRTGRTALMIAAEHRSAAAVRLLLGRGADTDIADERGWLPLMAACAHADVAVIRLLLNAGSSTFWLANDGTSALDLIVIHLQRPTPSTDLTAVAIILFVGSDRDHHHYAPAVF
jgi:ankyrin repeat protein